jgi:hypothetical protein
LIATPIGGVPQDATFAPGAQNHLAGGVDLTTAAVYGDDATVLGGRNNLQGRVSNGVAEGDECLTAAAVSLERFFHLEQDPDVRDDYQHIIDALNCDGKPCWKAQGTTGLSYKDKLGSGGGLTGLKLKSGIAGKPKVLVKAGGTQLALPALPLTIPVVVQLLIDDGVTIECWQTTFSDLPKKNEATKFGAKQ